MRTDILEVNPYKDVLAKEIENASSDEELEVAFRIMNYVQSVQMKATISGYSDSEDSSPKSVTKEDIEAAQRKEELGEEDQKQAAQELWDKLVGGNKKNDDDNPLTNP